MQNGIDDRTNLTMEKVWEAFHTLDPIQPPQHVFIPNDDVLKVSVRQFEWIARDLNAGEFICACENNPWFVGFKVDGVVGFGVDRLRLVCIRCDGKAQPVEAIDG